MTDPMSGLMIPMLAMSAGGNMMSMLTNASDHKAQQAAADRQRKLDILQSIISIAGGRGPMGIDATPNITPSTAGQSISNIGSDLLALLSAQSRMEKDASLSARAAAEAEVKRRFPELFPTREPAKAALQPCKDFPQEI